MIQQAQLFGGPLDGQNIEIDEAAKLITLSQTVKPPSWSKEYESPITPIPKVFLHTYERANALYFSYRSTN